MAPSGSVRLTRRTLAAGIAGSALLAGSLLGGAAATAAPSAPVTTSATVVKASGSTTLRTDVGIAPALLGAGIVAYTAAPGTNSIPATKNLRLDIRFPVVALDKKNQVIRHKGALVLVNPSEGKTVTVANLAIRLKQGVITGQVNGIASVDPSLNGKRLPVFKLDLSKARITKSHGTTTYRAVGVALNTAIPVGAVLNGALSTTVFADGLKLGNATVVVH